MQQSNSMISLWQQYKIIHEVFEYLLLLVIDMNYKKQESGNQVQLVLGDNKQSTATRSWW